MQTKFWQRREATICVSIAIAISFYFLSNFPVATSVSDFFYDADTPRTLNYLNDPTSAFSSLRPFLVAIASIGYLFNIVVSTYFAWCILNFFSIVGLGWSFNKYTNRSLSGPQIVLLLSANYSVLCWFAIPDTFVLAIAMFSIAIVIYGEGHRKFRVVSSGIIASSLNLFLLFPWLVTHLFIGRKMPRRTLSDASLVILVTSLVSASAQLLTKENYQSDLPPMLAGKSAVSFTSIFPFYGSEGLFGKVSVLQWIHFPWEGVQENLLSFLSAPWMPSYKYDITNLPSDSERFPVIALLLAISLSCVSFYGLFASRRRYRTVFVFCLSLEITVLILFVTYSTHPFLFSPFLILPRLLGIVMLTNSQKGKFYLLVFVSMMTTVISLQLAR